MKLPSLTLIATLFILVFLTAPLFILIVQSFTAEAHLRFPPESFGTRWYGYIFQSEPWREAGLRSLLVAGIVAPGALVIGTMAALGLDRGPGFGRNGLYALLIAPMVLPHLVLALGMLHVALSMGLEDTLLAIVLGHLTIAVPYVVVTVGASLQSVDRMQEEAARSLGANDWNVFRHVIFPAIRPGVLGGAIFAFIASFDEFIVTFFLATFQNTLPLQIFSTLSFQVEPSIAAASTLVLVGTALLTALILTQGQVVASGKIVK
ncbi:MAG: ABC transporter permease [Paracoccaceae bacterium]|nr:ABC transporter permease [Paracoccaceae bacterium]